MIITDITKFDSQRITLVNHKIKEIRETITDDELNKFNGSDWMRGSRFNSTERVLRTLLGKIYAECGSDHEAANKKFIGLNSMQTEPYIKKALAELAYGDYYYTYEKEY